MPHDKFGKKIEAGDEVIVRFKVKQVLENDTFCNVNLETVELMEGQYPTSLCAINTKQTERQ
jgi:hypothetical protein